ncbi:translation initiation factor eIF-2B [Halovenus sp. WSH3]|uniref:Translation initiation factor eIF-2B n=1 Tax=Halovenus carboxidivorans TaxID=2692199 RepID=A0A6B0T245_9EURY|nr:translation initiation factor eIF-2B [Halovenus carboxidivorans]MXR51217.1 translation initiation factor eIF-2B [Halovenus carboxidivorans]
MIDETAGEIADMQTHSSSVVAVKAARALREITDREFPTVAEYQRALERNSRALQRANPSHASLHNTQRRIVEHVAELDFETVEQAQAETNAIIDEVIEQVEAGKRNAAELAAEQLEDGETLLTHDYSTTVLSAVTRAVEEGKSFDVYVTEARPRFIGRKMARRLAEYESVDTTLIVDSACGHALSSVDRVLLGMTCVVEDTLYNRVGTYPIAAAAADAGVPVDIVGSSAKLVDGGFAFQNEHRVASEVMREPAEGFEIENPAYDATPTRLLDSIITDEGIKSADER